MNILTSHRYLVTRILEDRVLVLTIKDGRTIQTPAQYCPKREALVSIGHGDEQFQIRMFNVSDKKLRELARMAYAD